ncbi:hypothetical protein [Hoeflea sp.]|uniref:hypothetical protein n=1 Tax=Hoeflea sp. TaxID=1940281 RepID=UPI0025BD1B0A|nr:hypothetical protein [Hoeflea sp.]
MNIMIVATLLIKAESELDVTRNSGSSAPAKIADSWRHVESPYSGPQKASVPEGADISWFQALCGGERWSEKHGCVRMLFAYRPAARSGQAKV